MVATSPTRGNSNQSSPALVATSSSSTPPRPTPSSTLGRRLDEDSISARAREACLHRGKAQAWRGAELQVVRRSGGEVSSARAASWRDLVFALLITACGTTPKPATVAEPRREPPPSTAVEVALSVDDLPAHGPLAPGVTRLQIARRLLDAFTRHGVPRVYGFVNGKKAEQVPEDADVLSEWRRAGHPLANHTYSHLGLHDATLAEYFADIEAGEAVLKLLEPDARAWKYFRYPYLSEGETLEKRNGVRAWLHEHGYTIAHVTIDADDWAYNAPFARCAERNDADALAQLRAWYVDGHVEELRRMRALTRRLEQRDVPHVLLLHAGVADADAIDELLTRYEQDGVHWIDLPTALSDRFYAQDPAIVTRAGAALPYRLAKARGVSMSPPVYARDLEARLDATCR